MNNCPMCGHSLWLLEYRNNKAIREKVEKYGQPRYEKRCINSECGTAVSYGEKQKGLCKGRKVTLFTVRVEEGINKALARK